MRIRRSLPRSLAVSGIAVAGLALGLHAEKPAGFIPDATFKGSALTGWHVVGDADWKAQNGELIGTAKSGGGGWLVMDKGFQDVQLFANYQCMGECKSGVLLRMQKAADGGMRGVYVSLTSGEMGTYAVTLDAQGKELTRERIVPPGRGGGGGGNAARAGGANAARGAGNAARGAGAGNAPAGNAAAGNAPAAPARAGGGGGGGGGAAAAGRGAAPTLGAGEWHAIDVLIADTNLRTTAGNTTLDEQAAAGFGPVAFYVGGTGEVRYKDLAWKDLNSIVEPDVTTSSRYTAKQISSMYYGWSAAASDINHDGNLDIVAGPFYFLGPKFNERRIYRTGRVYNPATEYAPDMVNLTADFTGDGWPDILSSGMEGGRPMDLYVNPKGEARRWDHFRVLPTISTEIVLKKDLDGDGKPEILFGGAGVYAWAHPDPANPTAVWTSHPISVQGQPSVPPHGIGVGDVNGDKRLDVVVPFGWFEQPAAGISASPWIFHPFEFGDNKTFGNGGGEMGVYDVNGDGLTDVVSGQAHNWGMNWFEQKKAADGSITFVQHPIAMNFATENMGDVVFSESHAARFVDMNGDGIPDFVTGKRYWSHLENYNGEDPYGPAVLYVYRTVRDPKAPGGARFEPELIHNRSGIGSSFEVIDLNKDGVPDIATSGGYGTFVFLSKPTARPAPATKR